MAAQENDEQDEQEVEPTAYPAPVLAEGERYVSPQVAAAASGGQVVFPMPQDEQIGGE